MGNYERHRFQDESLPVLFHLDHVSHQTGAYPHWHENIELLYCIAGQGEAVIDSRPVPLREGGLTIVNSSRVHYTKAISDQVSYYCLIVDSALLEKFDLYVEQREFTEFVTDEEIKTRFERIIQEMKDKQICYEAVVKGEIAALMAYLSRHCSSWLKTEGKNNMVKLGMQYIKKHYRESISLDEVARAAGFSRYYFCRGFKNVTGYTVNEYLQYHRCREAERLLRETDCTVSAAAAKCGFDDVSYFTKIFKKQTGTLPSHVKKEGHI